MVLLWCMAVVRMAAWQHVGDGDGCGGVETMKMFRGDEVIGVMICLGSIGSGWWWLRDGRCGFAGDWPEKVKMDDPNITMEEYIRLEEEKARRHGRTFNWQTATFGKIENYEDEDDCFIDFETEFPAIVFDKLTAIPSEPTVCPPNENEIDFRISLDESDDEDYTTSLKEFENEFSAIVYNDARTSKSDNLTKPILNPQHIDEFNLNNETSLSEYNEENVSCFNDMFNIIHLDDSRSEKYNDDNDIDIEQSLEGNKITHGMSYTEMGLDVTDTLCFQLGGVRRRMIWRQFILALGLHTEQEMAEAPEKEEERLGCLEGTLLKAFDYAFSFEEEMHDLRHEVKGLRGVDERFTTEQSRVSTCDYLHETTAHGPSGHTLSSISISTLISKLRARISGESGPGIINRDYSLIPIPGHHNIDNPDDLCKTEEFTIVRHSIGDDEEFITISPSKINTVERTPGSMSCIYHELLNRKDHGWEEQYDDLAETMIWYMLKKTRVELIRAF
ncbi:hypothetical protein Tco_1505159 [Tanacetum coccineum]